MTRNRTKPLKPPLAYEFVYLDEVATQSLTATLDGGIIRGSKESRGSQWESGIGSKLASDGAGVTSSLRTVSTRAVEISRQEVAESHFARLHRRLIDLRLLSISSRPPPKILGREKGATREAWAKWTRGQERLIKVWGRNRQCVDVRDLRRGSLLEVDVQMDEPALYNLASAVGSFAEAARNLRKLDTDMDLVPDAHLGALENMFHWIRGGMVPMSGTVVSHVLASNRKRSIVLDKTKASALSGAEGWETKSLRIAGYCSLDSFWQHPSRVFTNGAVFRCLIRVEHPDVDRPWDELDHLSVFDSLGANIRGAARSALDQIRSQQVDSTKVPPTSFGQVLETHAATVAHATGQVPQTEPLQDALDHQWAILSPEVVPVMARRTLLKKVESAFDLGTDINLEDLRSTSFMAHGREPDGTVIQASNEPTPESPGARALRVHFVGISW